MSSIKWHTEDDRLLPVRATKNSVGYDFKAPNTVTIAQKETVIIDTLVAYDFFKDSSNKLLQNRCWYFEHYLWTIRDATKEEATNDFIESLLVKEG